jgi:hypothetical protein
VCGQTPWPKRVSFIGRCSSFVVPCDELANNCCHPGLPIIVWSHTQLQACCVCCVRVLRRHRDHRDGGQAGVRELPTAQLGSSGLHGGVRELPTAQIGSSGLHGGVRELPTAQIGSSGLHGGVQCDVPGVLGQVCSPMHWLKLAFMFRCACPFTIFPSLLCYLLATICGSRSCNEHSLSRATALYLQETCRRAVHKERWACATTAIWLLTICCVVKA